MRRGRTRGIILADFIMGTLIFSTAVASFFALTEDKFKLLDTSEMRTRALAAAELEVDRVRLEGMRAEPRGLASLDGFRRVSDFKPMGHLAKGEGIVEARALRMKGAAAPLRLFEVRVTVRWRDSSGSGRVHLSTVATSPKRNRRPR